MAAVVLVGVGALSLGLGLLVWSLLTAPAPQRAGVRANLRRGLTPAEPEVVAGGGAPAAGVVDRLAEHLTSAGTRRRLDRLLARAGRPAGWPLRRVLAARVVLPLALGALGAVYLAARPGPVPLLLVVVVVVVSHVTPDLLLHSRGQERQQQITLELADTLDQMTIAVDAGLGFEAAMARAGRNGKGPLAEELVRTLQDVQVGRSRRQAYEALVERTGTPDLRRFVRAVLQADAYGISIADVLRTQAAQMRLKRRQRAEEKAMQIPVKVVFPLMLCILPVLFIVLLGPAAIDMVAAFG